MEGCATLVHWDEVRPSESAAYRRACEIMTSEVNAAALGAFDGGAQHVLVNDSHSTMRNLISERLDPRVRVVAGATKPAFMLEGLGAEHAAAFFIGYHGAVGDRDAVMPHTYSPRVIHECRLNGTPVGEVSINAAFAGHLGVPVALVSGDATTLSEVGRILPKALQVETKRSIGAHAALCKSPAAVCDELRSAANHALRNIAAFETASLETPIVMEIDTVTTAHADAVMLSGLFTRLAPRTIRHRAGDAAQMYHALMHVIKLGAAA